MVVRVEDHIGAVRTRLGGTVRRLVTGSASVPPGGPHPDGLFGSDAIVRQVHADVSMFVGGLRALLVQTLHPLAMAGVADHSDYRDDPWGRLRRTGQFIGVTTFGSEADARAAIGRVRSVHDRVVGTAPDGRAYDANDPHLLAWIHVTEVDSFLAAYQRYGARRLSPDDADRYVAEMAVVADLLGAEPVPTTVAGLARWIDRVRPELTVGRQAREAVGFLLAPPVALPGRAPYAVISAAAIGLLPPWARRKLWLPAAPLSDPLVVRPATRALLASLDWALAPGRPRER